MGRNTKERVEMLKRRGNGGKVHKRKGGNGGVMKKWWEGTLG